MTQQGYQSDVIFTMTANNDNTQENLIIAEGQYNPEIVDLRSGLYSAVGGNLIICRDIRFINVGATDTLTGHLFNLPALATDGGAIPSPIRGRFFTRLGNPIDYSIEPDGLSLIHI